MKNPFKQTVFASIFTCLISGGVLAQVVSSRIEGTVKDPSGAVVANASVRVTNRQTQLQRTTTTNNEGFFSVSEIPSGNYDVRIEQQGFQATDVRDVIVQVGTPATLNIQLETGAINTSVEVKAEDVQESVNTTNAEIGEVVDRRRVLDLPLDGRNPLDLITLQAGASETGRVNGNRARGLNITINGLNASDNFNKSEENIISNPTVPVSVESVREFRVTTGLATAEFGRGSAQVNVISQSGGNRYSGSLFEFHRNRVFNANNFFNNRTIDINTGKSVPREFLIRNQFGGRFGGPLTIPSFGGREPIYNGKDRTFFFVSYEGTRLAASETVNRYVLTQEARNGNFRYLNGLITNPANVAANPNAIRSVSVLGINNTRQTIDPTMAAFIGRTALPNNFDIGDGLNSGGFRFNARRSAPKDIYTMRLDHRFTDKFLWEFNYSYGNDFQYGDYVNGRLEQFPGGRGVDRLTRSRSISTALQMNFTPQTVNEFRFGFVNPATNFTNENFKGPYLIYLGYSSRIPLSDAYRLTSPNGRSIPVTQFIDNLTHVRGNHLMKAGFDIRLLRGKVFSYNDALPAVNFNATDNDPGFVTANFPGISTASANLANVNAAEYLANILTGAIGSIEQTFNADSPEAGFVSGAPVHRNYATEEFDFYAQDTWKFRPNLTLSFGLRYEFSTTPRDRDGLVVLPVGGKQGIYGPTPVGSLFVPGNATMPRTTNNFQTGKLFNTDANNFAPVVSFAWSPFKDNKTSLRAGYRISYIRENFNLYENIVRSNSGLSIYNDFVVGNRFLRDGVPTVPTPAFTLPLSLSTLFQRSSSVNVLGIDEKLKTPFMQEWTASVEREVFKDTVVELRYVGNVSKNLIRVYDINEVNVFAVDTTTGQSFLQAFNVARANLAAGSAITLNNPLFGRIFSGSGASAATSSTVQTYIRNGEAGELADYISRATIGGVRGSLLFNSGLPINFFRANPDAYGAYIAENGSRSSFHALQAEVRRRFRNGFSFQANYQFGKELADFTGTTTNLSAFVTLRDKNYEYRIQSPLHQVKANFIYELPFGKNRRFFSGGGISDVIFGGWQLGGIFSYQSGTPLSVYSGLGTLNAAARSGINTVNNISGKSVEDLRGEIGVQTIKNLLYYFDPTQFRTNFENPQPGTLGNLSRSAFIGPNYFRSDFIVIKRTRITENQNIEFRAEAFNAFNRANFRDPNMNYNSPNFGIISAIRGNPRIFQFALRYNF